jgi:hypothetical protein
MQKMIKTGAILVALLIAFIFYKKTFKDLKTADQSYWLIKGIDEQVIEKLVMAKELQVHYMAEKGKYAKHWDSLFNFVRHDSIMMTQEKEFVIHRAYGGDSIYHKIDTIGIISAYDSLRNKLGGLPLSQIESLKYAPGHPADSLVEFFLNAGIVSKLPVFEIYDPKPLNPKRTKPKDRGGMPPLKIGSMQGPSVKGNWEY